jgi:hypothetical protein
MVKAEVIMAETVKAAVGTARASRAGAAKAAALMVRVAEHSAEKVARVEKVGGVRKATNRQQTEGCARSSLAA